MPVLLLVTELVRLRATFVFRAFLKVFLFSRVSAALARFSRAFDVNRLVERGVRRAYAPRPLIDAMCVTPAFRVRRRFVRFFGALT